MLIGPRLTAALALSAQMIALALGTIGQCLERPHVHGTTTAADCHMHHPPRPQPAQRDQAHHQHHAMAAPESPSPAAVLQCACASDARSFLIGAAAVLKGRAVVRAPASAFAPRVDSATQTLDLRLPAPAPPPRHGLA